MASTAAAMDLRALLDYDTDSLAKGFMLLKQPQRAELRRVLDIADSLSGAKAEGEPHVRSE